MKEFAREWLTSMTDEQKLEYLSSLPPEAIWRMAEGNPHQTNDNTHTIIPVPIMDVPKDHGDEKDQPAA